MGHGFSSSRFSGLRGNDLKRQAGEKQPPGPLRDHFQRGGQPGAQPTCSCFLGGEGLPERHIRLHLLRAIFLFYQPSVGEPLEPQIACSISFKQLHQGPSLCLSRVIQTRWGNDKNYKWDKECWPLSLTIAENPRGGSPTPLCKSPARHKCYKWQGDDKLKTAKLNKQGQQGVVKLQTTGLKFFLS